MQANQGVFATPDSLNPYFKSYSIALNPAVSSGHVFEDKGQLISAITNWIDNETTAAAAYGDINTWDVSQITDFSELFRNRTTFN